MGPRAGPIFLPVQLRALRPAPCDDEEAVPISDCASVVLSSLFFQNALMKYVRYTIAGLLFLLVLVWAGNWVFAKGFLGSPFASPLMARGVVMWGALAAGLLATTWKRGLAFAGLGGLGAWALLHGVFIYHQHFFPVP